MRSEYKPESRVRRRKLNVCLASRNSTPKFLESSVPEVSDTSLRAAPLFKLIKRFQNSKLVVSVNGKERMATHKYKTAQKNIKWSRGKKKLFFLL